MDNNTKPLILIVEDDDKLNMVNRRALESEGCEIKIAYNLKEARFLIEDADPDVILLDVKLPDGSGFDFCREIRDKSTSHIIFLTSVKEKEGELEGLTCGGDDYLRKPYGIDLLRERVKIGLKKEKKLPQEVKRGPFTLNIVSSQCFANGRDMLLNPKEFAVLLLLAQNERKTLSAEYIYEKAWGPHMVMDKNTIQATISRLRAKLEPYGYTICHYRGKGYAFEEV
jgi:DNA-binding response OmpR family regulator